MNKKELIELLNTLKIDKSEFTILSTSALVIRNIYDKANDLDIAVTKKGLEQLKQNYNLKQKDNGWYIVNELIECVQDDMINQKELVEEYYLQDLINYKNYLEKSDREKDKIKLEIVKNYLDQSACK